MDEPGKKHKNRKIFGLVNTNRFNPFLCDGVSKTEMERSLFLKELGHRVFINTLLTNEKYKKEIFEYADNSRNAKLQVKSPNFRIYSFSGVTLVLELLPFGEKALLTNYQQVIGRLIRFLKENSIDCVFTLEDDFITLVAATVLETAGAHIFHSLSCIYQTAGNPLFINLLEKRKVFVASNFLKSKLKIMTGLESSVWHPLIKGKGPFTEGRKSEHKNSIGYYSAGRHKGDEIVNRIILQMPQYNFLIIGRNYNHNFKKIPDNVKYLGDTIDTDFFFSQTKLILVPSLIEEGFPRIIVEACIKGIPVIANKIGGIPEALGNSGFSINVDPDHFNVDEIADKYTEKITALMENPAEYLIYSKKAVSRGKEYLEQQQELNRRIYENFFI